MGIMNHQRTKASGAIREMNKLMSENELLEPLQWRGPAARSFIEMPKIPPKQ